MNNEPTMTSVVLALGFMTGMTGAVLLIALGVL